jgi:transketolase
MELHEKEMRQVYAETLIEIAGTDPRLVVMEADLSKASGTTPFAKAYPERFIDVGVAEANMMGVAAGLAAVGKVPFTATFSCFATRRCYDQISISIAYAKRNVKIVGTSPGVTATMNGGTHMCFQDLAIMRAMPNMTVLSPADAYELRSMLKWMAATEGPMYLQLLRMKEPKVFGPDYVYRHGQAVQLRTGDRATLVTTGFTAKLAVAAADELAAHGISVDLLHCPSVKPLDLDAIEVSARKTGYVVTIENQNILGGLGGAVCEGLAERFPVRVKRLGVPDSFGEVATEEYLLDKHRFNVSHIVAAVRECKK